MDLQFLSLLLSITYHQIIPISDFQTQTHLVLVSDTWASHSNSSSIADLLV
jgi:hypothetical protein